MLHKRVEEMKLRRQVRVSELTNMEQEEHHCCCEEEAEKDLL